jgi:hypothetical protein
MPPSEMARQAKKKRLSATPCATSGGATWTKSASVVKPLRMKYAVAKATKATEPSRQAFVSEAA